MAVQDRPVLGVSASRLPASLLIDKFKSKSYDKLTLSAVSPCLPSRDSFPMSDD
jgi:hypothetical protein